MDKECENNQQCKSYAIRKNKEKNFKTNLEQIKTALKRMHQMENWIFPKIACDS